MTVAYTYNLADRALYERVHGEIMPEGVKTEGMVLYAAGEEQDGALRLLEVWESDELRDRWANATLLPALKRNGVDVSQGPPEWTRVEVQTLITR